MDVYRFPSNTTGGFFSFSENASDYFIGAALPPASLEINVDCYNDTIFDTHCKDCNLYTSRSSVYNVLKKKFEARGKSLTCYEMTDEIDKFYNVTKRCASISQQKCLKGITNNLSVPIRTPELELVKHVNANEDADEEDGKSVDNWMLLFKAKNQLQGKEYVGYQIGNVSSTGYICWGDLEQPWSHDHACADFFASTFNSDMTISYATNPNIPCTCGNYKESDCKAHYYKPDDLTYVDWFQQIYLDNAYREGFDFPEDNYTLRKAGAKGLIIINGVSHPVNVETEKEELFVGWILEESDAFFLVEFPHTTFSNWDTQRQRKFLIDKKTQKLAEL